MSAPYEYRWTPERDEAAIRLWKKGHSASHIAMRIRGVSRNAVIGRLHRLGYCGRRNQGDEQATINRIRHNAYVRKAKKAKLRLAHAVEKRKAIRKAAEKPLTQLLRDLPTEPLPNVDATPPTISFNGLEAHHCRAITVEHLPFDADARIYCGERKVLGQQYCADHCRRYFNFIATDEQRLKFAKNNPALKARSAAVFGKGREKIIA